MSFKRVPVGFVQPPNLREFDIAMARVSDFVESDSKISQLPVSVFLELASLWTAVKENHNCREEG